MILKYSLPEISVEVLERMDVLMSSPEATQPATQPSTEAETQVKRDVDNSFRLFSVLDQAPNGGWFN